MDATLAFSSRYLLLLPIFHVLIRPAERADEREAPQPAALRCWDRHDVLSLSLSLSRPRVRGHSRSASLSAHKRAALLSSGALTARALWSWCCFLLGHYVVLKVGHRGALWLINDGRDFLPCCRLLRGARCFLPATLERVEVENRLGGGFNLVSLHPSINNPPPPSPRAVDRLWGCGRADYRPVPLGVGAILPLPLLFFFICRL